MRTIRSTCASDRERKACPELVKAAKGVAIVGRLLDKRVRASERAPRLGIHDLMVKLDKADESSIGELKLKLRQGQSSTFSTFPPPFNRGSSY